MSLKTLYTLIEQAKNEAIQTSKVYTNAHTNSIKNTL